MVDLNNEAYHVPSLHRESLLPFLSDHCTVDTFGPHSRMCVPFKGLETLADVPEADWPERLDTIMVTCIFPATVLMTTCRVDRCIGSHPAPILARAPCT